MNAAWKILACAMAALTLVSGLAVAQSSSSSSSASGGSFSHTSSIGHSNVLGALALGAGGRSTNVDRDAAAQFVSTQVLTSDPCVVGARYRGGEWFATTVPRGDAIQIRLAGAIALGEGGLTAESLAQAFEDRRDALVLADCGDADAMRVSELLFGECARYGRGCSLAVMLRILLDADGLDAAEEALAFDALR